MCPVVRRCGLEYNRIRGLVVMIVACQVMDPGSIPGERMFFCSKRINIFLGKKSLHGRDLNPGLLRDRQEY